MKTFSTSYHKATAWDKPLPNMDSPQTLILVFGSSSYLNLLSPFEDLKQKYPQSIIAGCSTAGEILGDEILDDSLVVSISCFDHTKLCLFTAPSVSMETSYDVGADIAKNLSADDLSGVLVLADGLNVNGTALAKGINAGLSNNIIVTGGLAGDGSDFLITWVLVDGLPQSEYICGVGLYGDTVKIGHGSQGGWKTFGPDRLITKSSHNVLYELDGKPALELYKKYLGDMAEGLPATGLRYPLALSNGNSDKRLVRTILAINEEAQSLTFAGDIPEGHYAQLMFATFDNLIDGAEESAKMISINPIEGEGEDVLAIAISCVGRRMVMDEDSGAELEATLEFLPKNTSQIGFYSYGELSPCVKNASCDLHNQTMTITTIHE
ncbi:MAG TPA: hypothetical protein EYG68_09160 [Leucothrix mucor]|nr:hypothetical protein [Leucothrix mucor]